MAVTSIEAAGISIRNYPVDGVDSPDIHLNLLIGQLCNDADIQVTEQSKTVIGEPTEAALVDGRCRRGLIKRELEAKLPRVGEVPFDLTGCG